MTRIILIICFLCCFIIKNSHSQAQDFEVWTGVQINKKVNKKLRISFEEEFRINENASQIKKFYSDFGCRYKINPKISFGIYYRFINNQNNNIQGLFSKRHRFYADIIYKKKINRYSVSYRFRYQTKYTDVNSNLEGMIPRNYIRNKITLNYNISKSPINPFLSCETHYAISYFKRNEISKIRYTIGTEYKFNKQNRIDLYYRIQHYIHSYSPIRLYIIGISYSRNI